MAISAGQISSSLVSELAAICQEVLQYLLCESGVQDAELYQPTEKRELSLGRMELSMLKLGLGNWFNLLCINEVSFFQRPSLLQHLRNDNFHHIWSALLNLFSIGSVVIRRSFQALLLIPVFMMLNSSVDLCWELGHSQGFIGCLNIHYQHGLTQKTLQHACRNTHNFF